MQRSLGARSEFEAKASYVWGAVLKNCIPLIIAVPGLVAVLMFPDLSDGDDAFPMLVRELLPTGLRGLFLAAFLAALMSSVDSYLNSAATIASHDVYRRFLFPAATPEQLLRVGRVTTVALVIWGIFFACGLIYISQGIYSVFQTMMAFFQGPALAILLLGVFWRRATGSAALVGLICGIATSISLFAFSQPVVLQKLGWEPLFKVQEPFLYFSIWAFLVTASITVFGSLLTRAEPAAKLEYVYQRSTVTGSTVTE
jgi:SSS family solute:Na+ symporter